jgi:AraC-like DNA-binding protein
MATPSEQPGRSSARDVRALFAQAHRQVLVGPAGVRELRLSLEGPPLRLRSRLLTSGPLTFVRGENLAGEDMMLRHEGQAPQVSLHSSLRGSASALIDDLGATLAGAPGDVQLFASPTSRTTIQLRAHVKNEAFRITMAPPMLAGLAARYPQLEPVAARVASARAFCLPAVNLAPLPRLVDEVVEIMDSDHYGEVRPLFLESRALGWLARALAMAPALAPPPGGLPRREVDRMHQARELLRSRLARPPSLVEVAAAVGTNDFALKRNFKAVFGRPVHGYLLDLRLAHACQLLRETRKSIKEIAGAVGYLHPGHFSTAFRHRYGVSPGRFRLG